MNLLVQPDRILTCSCRFFQEFSKISSLKTDFPFFLVWHQYKFSLFGLKKYIYIFVNFKIKSTITQFLIDLPKNKFAPFVFLSPKTYISIPNSKIKFKITLFKKLIFENSWNSRVFNFFNNLGTMVDIRDNFELIYFRIRTICLTPVLELDGIRWTISCENLWKPWKPFHL